MDGNLEVGTPVENKLSKLASKLMQDEHFVVSFWYPESMPGHVTLWEFILYWYYWLSGIATAVDAENKLVINQEGHSIFPFEVVCGMINHL